jgi:hypothetical protein
MTLPPRNRRPSPSGRSAAQVHSDHNEHKKPTKRKAVRWSVQALAARLEVSHLDGVVPVKICLSEAQLTKDIQTLDRRKPQKSEPDHGEEERQEPEEAEEAEAKEAQGAISPMEEEDEEDQTELVELVEPFQDRRVRRGTSAGRHPTAPSLPNHSLESEAPYNPKEVVSFRPGDSAAQDFTERFDGFNVLSTATKGSLMMRLYQGTSIADFALAVENSLERLEISRMSKQEIEIAALLARRHNFE